MLSLRPQYRIKQHQCFMSVYWVKLAVKELFIHMWGRTRSACRLLNLLLQIYFCTHTHTHTQNRAQVLWHPLVFLFSLCVRSRDSLVKIATSSPNKSLLQDSSESGKLRKPPHYFSSTINQISGSVVLSVTFDLAQKEVNTADVNCKKTGCYVNTINFSTVRVRELYAE